MIPPSKFKKPTILLQNQENLMIVDVRSPMEFEEDHIPGAINFPVLNNSERKLIGTMYKQDQFSAKKLGARIISKNISIILEKIETAVDDYRSKGLRKPDKSFLIYCWRGGMRSSSLFTVMDMVGYKTYVLDGGYKAYRHWINEYIQKINLSNCIVLHGPSGSGKTKILEMLNGGDIFSINLESLANHNGSVFGGKKSNQPSQKLFESKIVSNLINSKPTDLFIIEGESKKIGKLSLPGALTHTILNAKRIWIELPLKIRAELIANEYEFTEEEFFSKLVHIKRYLPSDIINEIEKSFFNKDYIKVAMLLLEHHYDILYRKSFRLKIKNDDITISGNSINEIYSKIKKEIQDIHNRE